MNKNRFLIVKYPSEVVSESIGDPSNHQNARRLHKTPNNHLSLNAIWFHMVSLSDNTDRYQISSGISGIEGGTHTEEKESQGEGWNNSNPLQDQFPKWKPGNTGWL